MDSASFGFTTAIQTSTPVTNRGYTNNTTPLPLDPGVEWTTARCHRLLRALTSRVAILTKDLARFSTADQAADRPNRRAEGSKIPDEDWNITKKKLKQTYSGKSRKGSNGQRLGNSSIALGKKPRRSLDPGELSIPTPILSRAKRDFNNIEDMPNWQLEMEAQKARNNKRKRTKYTLDESNASFQLSETLREIRQKTSAARYTTYEGVYGGLEALLVATTSVKREVKRKGARSLFSMALRAVPTYITQQEILVKDHMKATGSKSALADRDMATEIYDELADFGSSGHSWKHLRTVVRSHGIQVMSNAIRAGILETNFVGCLITLCIRVSALDEAQILFSALLSSSHYSVPKSVYEKPDRPLSMLWKFTEHTGSRAFQYRELLNMLHLGLLPADWFATKSFAHVWTGLFQTLSSGAQDLEALNFLNELLPILHSITSGDTTIGYASMSDAISNTFSSVLTTLSAIVMLSNEETISNKRDSSNTELDLSKNITVVLLSCGTQVRNEAGCFSLLAFLSILSTQGTIDSRHVLVDWLLKQLPDRHQIASESYSQAVAFVCSIAYCCGRGASNSGFEYLQQIHQLLLECNDDSSTSILKCLVVDSAFEFAEEIPQRDHLQYAADMDASFCVRRFEPSFAAHNLNEDGYRSGFRWEEGIGEWVTASPLATRKIAASVLLRGRIECDTPYKPAADRRRKTEIHFPILKSTEKSSGGWSGSAKECTEFPIINTYHDLVEAQEDLYQRGSDDELGPNSSQLSNSFDSEVSFDEADMSFTDLSFMTIETTRSTDQTLATIDCAVKEVPRLIDAKLSSNNQWGACKESSMSTASSENLSSARRTIDRVPRLGHKALRSSNTWEIFEDSDDELSFISVSSQPERILREVTNTSRNTHSLKKRAEKRARQSFKTIQRRALIGSDSEDELCK